MAKGNHAPRLENLTNAGKGRKKLDKIAVSIRLSPEDKEALRQLAKQYGCFFGDEPYIGGLLEKIARKELIVVPAPPSNRIQ
jgi:hypothetical protein